MTQDTALIEAMQQLVHRKGDLALQMAKKKIRLTCNDSGDLSGALKHFSNVTLRGSLPVFSALIALSCEAVGEKAEKTTRFGAAIVMVTGAADLHDDVIDKSVTKGVKETVFGKFGETVAVLAGDALLVAGLAELQSACRSIPPKQAAKIEDLVKNAVFTISKAETIENKLKRSNKISPGEFLEIIKLKAVVPELMMKIGAVLGGGEEQVVEALGRFGSAYGVLTIILEEFANLLDIEELKNRLRNEVLPLPLLYALECSPEMTALLPLLKADSLDEKVHEQIVELVFSSKSVRNLQEQMRLSVTDELCCLRKLDVEIKEGLELILSSPLRCLELLCS
jgi:geranylgeranyl pyrophosphate synthase